MRFTRAGIIKFIFTALLVLGGCAFIMSIPTLFVKTIDWLIKKTEPKYDEDGKPMYHDWRKTIRSFGKRKIRCLGS